MRRLLILVALGLFALPTFAQEQGTSALNGFRNNDGFNELFITSLIVNQKSDVLNLLFPVRMGVAPGETVPRDLNEHLRSPAAANIPWGTINDYIYRLSTHPNLPAGVTPGGKVIRDIIPIAYLEPTSEEQASSPFESQIVSMLTMYRDWNMKLILAFGLAYQHYDEPQWLTAKVNAAYPETHPEYGVHRMYYRSELLGQIIGRAVKRLYHNYGDESWRAWFRSNVSIEAINEVNANLSGDPTYAVTVDNRVVAEVGTRARVIQSSITSGSPDDYADWYFNPSYGYYNRSGNPSLAPNVHFYHVNKPPVLSDQGSFLNSLFRFRDVLFRLDADYINKFGYRRPMIVGEIGQPFRGDCAPYTGPCNYLDTNFHLYLAANINNPTFFPAELVDSIAIWRLLGNMNFPFSAYDHPEHYDVEQRVQGTFGLVRRPTCGTCNGWPWAETFEEVEPQAVQYYGL